MATALSALGTPLRRGPPRQARLRFSPSSPSTVRHCACPFPRLLSTQNPAYPALVPPELQADSLDDPHLPPAPPAEREPSGFDDLPLTPDVLSALREGFPGIVEPTPAQLHIIRTIVGGRDLLLKAGTGEGKSFSLLLSLLSIPPAAPPLRRTDPSSPDHQPPTRRSRVYFDPLTPSARPSPPSTPLNADAHSSPSATVLLLVPHTPLLNQYLAWLTRLFPHTPLSTLAQTFYRSPTHKLSSQIALLRRTKPRLLLGTPNGFLDLFRADPALTRLRLAHLRTVALDEADALVGLPNSGRYTTYKQARHAHAPAVQDVLDRVFSERDKKLQFLAASATLNAPLRGYLRVERAYASKAAVFLDAEAVRREARGRVTHACVVVAPDGSVRNMKGAGERRKREDDKRMPLPARHARPKRLPPVDEDENLFEAIAAAWAVAAPPASLLVIPPGASLRRTCAYLRELAVPAKALDELPGVPSAEEGAQDSDDAVLYVTHTTQVRGLDLPALSHVFLAGLPPDPVQYKHISGRVGRLGQRDGTFVTFVRGSDAPAEEVDAAGKRSNRSQRRSEEAAREFFAEGEEGQAQRLFRDLGVFVEEWDLVGNAAEGSRLEEGLVEEGQLEPHDGLGGKEELESSEAGGDTGARSA